MYMTMAIVAPENVRFAVPDLALPDMRELSTWEIDAVEGGSAICAGLGLAGARLGAGIGSVLGPWGAVGGAAVLGVAAWAACEFG